MKTGQLLSISKKEIKRLLWLFSLLWFTLPVSAQIMVMPLKVTVVAKPPVSSVFSEYADLSNKVIITVVNPNTSAVIDRITLHGSLKRTSDEFITTIENYAPSQLLTFNPLETKVFTVDPVQLRFLRKEVVRSSFPELLPLVLKNDLLPEGNWELCVQAMAIDFDGIALPASDESCFPLNIMYAAPPVIMSPLNGQTVPSLQPHVIFSWTPPAGNIMGAQVVYDLYAVKVMPGQSPNDAINAAVGYKANNPLIKTDLFTNQYITQPYDLKLDTGATYAVQVIARDLNKKVVFQNDGRSEVTTFNYGNTAVISIVQASPVTLAGQFYQAFNYNPVPVSEVKGKLLYRFETATGVTGATVGNQPPNLNYNVTTHLPGQPVPDQMKYNQEPLSTTGAKPLANTKISLVLTYVLDGKIDNETYSGQVIKEGSLYNTQSYFKDMDKVISTTTTDADGNFKFNFLNVQNEIGLINDKFNLTTGGGEFKKTAIGKLYKVYRIKVENNYYCSSDANIKVDPWKGVDVGSLVALVKSYNLKVRVTWTNSPYWDSYKGIGTYLSGVPIYMLRKAKPQNAPPDEGEVKTANVVYFRGANNSSEKITDGQGYAIFHNLIQHDPNNFADRYYINCKPDKMAGEFIFDPKEKSYYPLWDKDKNYFPFNSIGEYIPSSGFKIPIQYGSSIIWNSELVVKTYTDSVGVYPGRPRIAGKVEVAKNVGAKPFVDVKVVSINGYKNNSDPSKLFTVVKTDGDGRYEFNNLDVETEGFKIGETSKVIGPTRTLITKPDGFKSGTYPANPPMPPMLWGEQKTNIDFSLEPDGWINGYVEDENGNAVESDVDIDGLIKVTTLAELIGQGSGRGNITFKSRQTFRTAAPSGNKRKISIQPVDQGYFAMDTIMNIKVSDGKHQPFIRFIVFKAQKRIRFQVLEKNTPGRLNLPGSSKPVSGATVKIDLPGQQISQVTDKQGYVSFTFESMAEHFDFIITPPADADYETGTYSLSGVKNSKEMKTYGPAYLRKSAVINGTVTLGTAKAPLEGATVYIEMGNGKNLETKTDAQGKYVLKGVPMTPATQKVWASKPGAVPNIISHTENISVKLVNTLDFNLEIDKEIVIDQIFGFDVDVQSKEKQKDGTWLLSGNLINIPANDNFTLQDNKQNIPFTNLKIKKSTELKNNIPVGIPAESKFSSDLASLKLMLQQSFGVVQTPESGEVIIISSMNNKGRISGKIAVQKSGFKISENYITFNSNQDNAFSLTDKQGSLNTTVTSIDVGGYAKKKFGVADLNGKVLTYTLNGFKAKADNQKSYLEGNSIHLATILSIENIPSMIPSKLEIDAGELVIHPDKFDPLNNNNPIKFKLEKWDFVGNNWILQQSSSSINIPEGTLKTGVVDIPLKNVRIKPDDLEIGDAQVNGLTLAGVTPVNVVANNPVFGYNPSAGNDHKPHWELRIIGDGGQPGVTIGNLPGMKAGDLIKFQKFSLISNGDQIIVPGNQAQIITFYNVLKAKPLGLTGGDKYFDFACGIDLDIPQLEEVSGAIRFSKPAGEIQFELYPINVSLHGPGNVDFVANIQFNDHPQQLTTGKFTAIGTIRDKEGINLKAQLNRTTNAAWIEVNPKNQKMALGSGSLTDIEGKMDADMTTGAWKNFTFSGRMDGFKGMQGDTRKTFTVYGSVTANNQKVEVKNIPSAFGDIGITYDVPNSRFIGDLQLNKQIGALYISGTANMVVDGSGWYFLAGGAVQTPGIGTLNAGMMVGDYSSISSDITQKIMQYAYDKNVPPSIQNKVSGFFFTGMKDLPVINIPDYSVDLGVISASFGAKAGLDARLWMGFDDAGNEYGIGAMAFVHAYLKGASITCTKFGAEARAELGMKGIYTSSNGNFSLKGCGSFSISGSVEQCVPTLCWSDGICCEYCGGVGVSQSIKVNLSLDSGGNTDLSFGFGNCSGQSNMTGNW